MILLENNQPERAILIGIQNSTSNQKHESFWTELAELTRTAGAEVVGKLIQSRENPNPATFLGAGKVDELVRLVKEESAQLIIAAQDLTPVQVRNLSEFTHIKVIDRTGLILDIFAQRAQTREGKLQVELAQLNYLLPRLTHTANFSRLGGGIGTRGPGETKLEVDRRRIRHQIADLTKELREVETNRMVQRQLREKNQIPTVAMVGYTNAGKSTLFNTLTAAAVSAQGRLFDTLDPVSRLVKLANHQEVLFLDTVGFIRELPHQLVAAFKATLEETVRSKVLLHVMDAGSPDLVQQYAAVKAVLTELGIDAKETIPVLNKVDLLDSENTIQRLANEWAAIPVSAVQGTGIEELRQKIQYKLAGNIQVCRMLLPFSEAGLLDFLHRKCRVLEEKFTEEGIQLLVELETSIANKYQRFLAADI